jgi:hypothetical protein
MSRVVTVENFPSELPPRPSSKSRDCCPNMRTCWHFSWGAYSLKTSDKAVLCRRLCMWLILGCRTSQSILNVIYSAYGGLIASLIVGSILGVIGFFFIAWCLATIGEAQGKRRVLRMMVVSTDPGSHLGSCC